MLKQAFNHIITSHFSFLQRVWLLLFVVVTCLLLLIASYFHFILSDFLTHQVSTRAVVQAREIAVGPELIEAIQANDVEKVQEYIGRQQRISDADFIVVGDEKGIRLVHPQKDKIGYPMQGGDNSDALVLGRHFYSISEGSLGKAIRGKSPIFSSDGEIIGVVSVGYLLDTVSIWLTSYTAPFFVALLIILFCCAVIAGIFSKHIKKQMYGMEPDEIAMSLRMQKSVFEAVYEGIIAVDKQGNILSVNKHALKILGIVVHPDKIKGQNVRDYLTPADFFVEVENEESLEPSEYKNKEITCNGETLIATRVRIWDEDIHCGWAVSFRRRDDVNILTSQLHEVRQQADNLRVVSHEYANKLTTISGLIQIGAHDQALNAIRKETESRQQFIDFITKSFNSQIIAALLLGKYSRAKELGLVLEFDPYCTLRRRPRNITEEKLAAVIGNLLDNAYDATLKNRESNKCISILISDDTEDELVIEIADNGTGISDDIADSLFEKGVTSKKHSGHGIGLYLVYKYITEAGGSILVDDAEPCGTIFSIFIPNGILKNGNA
jgi:two-component system cit operon sensor histidine kinase CitA